MRRRDAAARPDSREDRMAKTGQQFNAINRNRHYNILGLKPELENGRNGDLSNPDIVSTTMNTTQGGAGFNNQR